jgi:AcrR family transcriptional regulator
VDAARRIVARRGSIEAVPIEEIAEEAGVATGSFYNHFASKDELFEAAVSEAAEQHAARLEERIAGLDDVAEAIATGIRLTVRMVREDPIWGALAVRTGVYLGELWPALKDHLERDVRRGIESKRFRGRDVEITVGVIAGATSGVMLGTLEGVLAEDAESQLAELMLQLLGLPPGEAHEIAGRPLPDARRRPPPARGP